MHSSSSNITEQHSHSESPDPVEDHDDHAKVDATECMNVWNTLSEHCNLDRERPNQPTVTHVLTSMRIRQLHQSQHVCIIV